MSKQNPKSKVNTYKVFKDAQESYDLALKHLSEMKVSLDVLKTEVIKNIDYTGEIYIAAKDCSGSMGVWENYITQLISNANILNNNTYGKLEKRFIHFHTEAKEVTKEEFETRGESGGTIVSSAIREIKRIAEENPDKKIIINLFTDGDNLTSDCNRCNTLIKEIVEAHNVEEFTAFELNQYSRQSTFYAYVGKNSTFGNKFSYKIIKTKAEALKEL